MTKGSKLSHDDINSLPCYNKSELGQCFAKCICERSRFKDFVHPIKSQVTGSMRVQQERPGKCSQGIVLLKK